MAMEFFVLSDRRLASIAEWQQAITAEGFQLLLSTETPFEALNGFLPAHLGEKPVASNVVLPAQVGEQRAGFECAHCDPLDLIGRHPEVDFGRRRSHVLRFRWKGHSIPQTIAACMASAAYARATDGIIFDGGEGQIIGSQQVVELARDLEKDLPQLEEGLRLILEQMNADPSTMPQSKTEPPADGIDYTITVRRIN
jgi:hypothetical protein